jgi:hypothetical protein
MMLVAPSNTICFAFLPIGPIEQPIWSGHITSSDYRGEHNLFAAKAFLLFGKDPQLPEIPQLKIHQKKIRNLSDLYTELEQRHNNPEVYDFTIVRFEPINTEEDGPAYNERVIDLTSNDYYHSAEMPSERAWFFDLLGVKSGENMLPERLITSLCGPNFKNNVERNCLIGVLTTDMPYTEAKQEAMKQHKIFCTKYFQNLFQSRESVYINNYLL